MKWQDIRIKDITVDLRRHELSINGGSIILRATASKYKCIFLAYVAALTTKYPPFADTFKGFTWKYLNQEHKDLLEDWGLDKGAIARTIWNQICKKAGSWLVKKPSGGYNSWDVNGNIFLEKIFHSEYLSKNQRLLLEFMQNTRRMYFPEDIRIKLIPDIHKLEDFLSVQTISGTISDDDTVDKGNLTGTGIYSDTRAAIAEIAVQFPEVEEVVFVGYVSKLFVEDLRSLKTNWKIKNLRFLLRDLEAIDISQQGQIPVEEGIISGRRFDTERGLNDIKVKEPYELTSMPKIKYYNGHPCLRGVLVKEIGSKDYSAGFMSIYRQRSPENSHIDYAGRLSPVLRLSHSTIYEKTLLESFAAWFSFVWEKGSYEK